MCLFWKSRAERNKAEKEADATNIGILDRRIETKFACDMTPAEVTQACQVIFECFVRGNVTDDPEFNFIMWSIEHDQLYLYKVNEVIVGLVEYRNPGTYMNKDNIANLCVYENYRQRGIASKLLKKLISDHIREQELVLFVDKKPGDTTLIEFYQKFGFILDSRPKSKFMRESQEHCLRLARLID